MEILNIKEFLMKREIFLNKLKIFKVSSGKILDLEEKINIWAQEEQINILNVSSSSGQSYSGFGNRVSEKEMFVFVVFSK
jgi:hypothetical protein